METSSAVNAAFRFTGSQYCIFAAKRTGFLISYSDKIAVILLLQTLRSAVRLHVLSVQTHSSATLEPQQTKPSPSPSNEINCSLQRKAVESIKVISRLLFTEVETPLFCGMRGNAIIYMIPHNEKTHLCKRKASL